MLSKNRKNVLKNNSTHSFNTTERMTEPHSPDKIIPVPSKRGSFKVLDPYYELHISRYSIYLYISYTACEERFHRVWLTYAQAHITKSTTLKF